GAPPRAGRPLADRTGGTADPRGAGSAAARRGPAAGPPVVRIGVAAPEPTGRPAHRRRTPAASASLSGGTSGFTFRGDDPVRGGSVASRSMLERAVTLLVVSIVAMAGLAAGWWSPTAEAREAAEPLRYAPVREAASGRTLLADDPETGRVVEVIGDLDGAEHVAVVVPGTGQNRGNFRTSDRDAGTVPVQNGEALYAQMRKRSDRVAVVVWLGYRPPQKPNASAYRLESAREGADELSRFTREALPDGAHTTLACHSYGAAVCGLAAQHPGTADDVVALGAPGMGVDSAAEID